MKYEPHTLYKTIPGQSQKDEDGNYHTTEPSQEFICGCFQHDIRTEMKEGYQGVGIDPKFYVNLNRRNNISLGDMVEVKEEGETIGKGQVLDIKRTSGMRFGGSDEYMTIFI